MLLVGVTITALILGLAGGYYYGLVRGNAAGRDELLSEQKAAAEKAVKDAQEKLAKEANPFSKDTVNPFKGGYQNPFEGTGKTIFSQ